MARRRHASLTCDPSQNGGFAVCLHMHHATFFFSVISTFTGEKPLPLCAPSQNGCVDEYPQEHHQYVPGSISSTFGEFAQQRGSLMISFVGPRPPCVNRGKNKTPGRAARAS